MHSQRSTCAVVCLAISLVLCAPRNSAAQLRGFGDVGATAFSARESFAAILGSNAGPVFGAGAEVLLPHRLFATVRVSQFRKNGHRVFMFEGRPFVLDVDTTITVTPIEFSGGYRFIRLYGLTPYAGGGIGWHQYRETSEGASGNEDVLERFVGYHALGGLEYRLRPRVAAAVEAQWASVPDALGSDPDSVSAAFDEHDLGGFTVRVKVVVGR